MQIIFYKQLAALSLLLLINSLSHAQEHLAAIASVKGRVFIKPKTTGRWDTSAVSLRLSAGDSVKTGKNSKATILYFNGQITRLGSRQSFVVQAPQAERSYSSALKLLFGNDRPLTHGSRRGLDDPPVLIYPVYGKVLSSKPAFAWLSSGPGTTYWVKVYADTGSVCKISGVLLWQKTTRDTTLGYPADEPALVNGQKYWVEIGRQTSQDDEAFGCFAIATAAEQKNMRAWQNKIQKEYGVGDPDEVTPAIVYAAALVEQEFFTEAHNLIHQALTKQPKNPTLRAMLDYIHDEVGPPALIEGVR